MFSQLVNFGILHVRQWDSVSIFLLEYIYNRLYIISYLIKYNFIFFFIFSLIIHSLSFSLLVCDEQARPLLTQALEDGKFDELADPRLQGNYNQQDMARMVACAAASIRHSARKRPKMSQVLLFAIKFGRNRYLFIL